jgi:hypothetical protein
MHGHCHRCEVGDQCRSGQFGLKSGSQGEPAPRLGGSIDERGGLRNGVTEISNFFFSCPSTAEVLDERDHLLHLAGYEVPPRGVRRDHVSPALLYVLDQLHSPAQIISDLAFTLVQNPLAEALLGVQTQYTGLERSFIYRWFVIPGERSLYPQDDHDRHSRTYVANLRAVFGRDPGDVEARELIDALRRESPEFADLWSHHEVAVRRDTPKRIAHPMIVLLTLDCQVLTAENQTERLVVFTAAPGSEDANRLELLSVVGSETFAS